MTMIATRVVLSTFLFAMAAASVSAETPTTADSAYARCKTAYEAQDFAKAAKRCRKAAELGSAKGQNGLATLYLSGQGVPKDIDKAVKWFAKAAAQGDPQALNNLATLYFNGEGVTQDRPKAISLLRQAAAQGNAEAANNLKIIAEKFPNLLRQ